MKLSVKYETKMGQSIAVLGSIPELGNWTEVKVNMKWTTGHEWVMEQPVRIRSAVYFKYKYVLIEEGKLVLWERGIDRLIDLVDLADSMILSSQLPHYNSSPYGNVVSVSLADSWEKMKVHFSVFSPFKDPNEELYLLAMQNNKSHNVKMT